LTKFRKNCDTFGKSFRFHERSKKCFRPNPILEVLPYLTGVERTLGAKIDIFEDVIIGWEYLNNCNSKYSGKQVFVALTERITEKVSGIQLKLTKLKNIKKRNM
jgi:hypothetical protein